MVERDTRCEAQARTACTVESCREPSNPAEWRKASILVLSQVTCRGVVYAVSATAFTDDRRLQLVLRDGHYGCWSGNFTPECEFCVQLPEF